jgi:dihydrofolate synthase/folylpolyglutamate synthase
MIGREALAALVDEIEPHAAAVEGVTWFEIVTALAFLHFARSAIDVGVIEVGLGGRFDATNVLTPLVCVITSLSLDHTAWLGDTLDQIALEKAGIIKSGVPVVSALQKPEAAAVIERIAAERGAQLTVVGQDVTLERSAWSPAAQEFRIGVPASAGAPGRPIPLGSAAESGEPALQPIAFKIPLAGEHQVANAAAAIMAVEIGHARGIPVSGEAIRLGLMNACWPGRFEVVRRDPPLVIDGAHNVDSAQKLAAALDDYYPDRRWTLVFGSSSDKDIGGMLDCLLPLADRVIVTRAKSARAGDLEYIAELASDRGHRVEIAGSVHEAMAAVIESSTRAVVVTGSLYIVAEAREACFEHIGAPIVERDA